MPKWTDYTTKTEPADNDEVMVLDTAGKANKRLGLSALSDWIIGKIANKVFENLQTQNKTILGALNELNSNTGTVINTKVLNAETNFYNIPDGIYSFNVYSESEAPKEYMQPPRNIGDGIILVKTYAIYQTMCCIGCKGIAVAQKNIRNNNFDITWGTLCIV